MLSVARAKPKNIYPRVAEAFPDLTEEDRNARLPSSPSTFKWHNLVQWVRQGLVESGHLDGSTRGVWRLTPKGKARLSGGQLAAEKQQSFASLGGPVNLRDLVNENEADVKRRILAELRRLSGKQFEVFCINFLQLMGFQNLRLGKRGPDGGIDGDGDFRQGIVTIRSAVQAKQWKANSVSRPEIDKFRGAIQGDYDHGVFLTTGRFTSDAEAASIKKGAITILLLDGDAIVENMIRNGIGIRRQPVHLIDIDLEFFKFDNPEDLF